MSTKKKQEKRPSSDNFVDLHIFVVPYELWMEKYRTAYNSSTLESISAGFVRVPPLTTLEDLRNQMKDQLGGGDILPDEFVFLRCVGRCLAIVNKVQELSLKVKHFLPPVVASPEIFVLFGNHDSLSHTFASSLNTASDIQDYNTTVGKYLMYTREMDENSRSSSPERIKTENLDRDAIQRRVRFEHNNDGLSHENVDCLEQNIHENTIRTNEGKYLTDVPPATRSTIPEKLKHAQDSLNSGQEDQTLSQNSHRPDNQKSQKEGRRLSSSKSGQEQNLQNDQVYLDDVNGETSFVHSTDNRNDNHDTQQMSSSSEDKHSKTLWSKSQKKNPLLHSKTAASLLKTSWNDTVDGKSEDNDQNKDRNESKRGNGEHTESSNNKEGEYYISREYPDDHLEQDSKGNGEGKDKVTMDDSDHCGKQTDDAHNNKNINNNNENNFQTENIELASGTGNGEDYKETRVKDLKQENTKHSADTSDASSGFESLNQSNINNRNNDIADHTKNDYGVTIADKENLVLQLQAELNTVRGERSASEKSREQLLKKAKNLQNQNNQKRNQAKTMWKKRYFEEKKKTVSLEERCNQLRYEVEVIHKKILSSGDAKDHDSASAYLHKDGDPKKLNAKIMLTRKENEVEELRRRVEEAKIKLGSEMKLRDNAQKELKQIRDEVIDKKINATLVKKSLSLLETHSPNDA